MTFTKTELKHLEKLATAYFENLEWQNDYEYGAPGLDQKRPFGNSGVKEDILEIIELQPAVDCPNCGIEFTSDQYEYAESLFKKKLIPYLLMKWKETLDHSD